MENKTPFTSGKLTGTKTLVSALKQIEEPDDVEKFLLEFAELMIELPEKCQIKVVKSEEELKSMMDALSEADAVGIQVDDELKRLFITSPEAITYTVKISKTTLPLISLLISSEKPMKYILNGFAFVKWCSAKSIELKNVSDILVDIKLLTNSLDPFMTVQDYFSKYVKSSESENREGIFIYQFGKYLTEKINLFQLSSVRRIINENSYYEGIRHHEKEEETCKIRFTFIDLDMHIAEFKAELIKKFDKKAYVLSPLGRIAIKYGNNVEEIAEELCKDDIELKTLNELYNNNIRVELLAENLYQVECKYKNFNRAVTVTTAVLKDTFYTLFDSKVDIKIEAIVRE